MYLQTSPTTIPNSKRLLRVEIIPQSFTKVIAEHHIRTQTGEASEPHRRALSGDQDGVANQFSKWYCCLCRLAQGS